MNTYRKMGLRKAYDSSATGRGAYMFDIIKAKGPDRMIGPLAWVNSLTMSYFHTGVRTIIGAKAFHCPVRDGKEWDHLAMVIRLDW